MKTRLIIFETDAETGVKSVNDILEAEGNKTLAFFQPHARPRLSRMPPGSRAGASPVSWEDVIASRNGWSYFIERIRDDGTMSRDPTREELEDQALIKVLDEKTPGWHLNWASRGDLLSVVEFGGTQQQIKERLIRAYVRPSIEAALAAGIVQAAADSNAALDPFSDYKEMD